jgi:membrane protein
MSTQSKKRMGVREYLKDLYFRINDDDVTALAAQTTFYMILSIFPFIIFLVSLASYTPVSGEEVVNNLSGYIPPELSGVFKDIIDGIVDNENRKFASVGMLATIWAASYGVESLMRGIDKAYDQHLERSYVKSKLLSLLFTVALSVLFISSLLSLVFGKVIGTSVFDFFGISDFFKVVWGFFRFIFPVSFMVLIFYGVYRLIPMCKVKFKDIYPGLFFSVAGWLGVGQFFSYYFTNLNNFSATYGSIGGIIAFLMWMYWSSIIILVGAEINATFYLSKHKHETTIQETIQEKNMDSHTKHPSNQQMTKKKQCREE